MGVLGGGAVSYARGTPVIAPPPLLLTQLSPSWMDTLTFLTFLTLTFLTLNFLTFLTRALAPAPSPGLLRPRHCYSRTCHHRGWTWWVFLTRPTLETVCCRVLRGERMCSPGLLRPRHHFPGAVEPPWCEDVLLSLLDLEREKFIELMTSDRKLKALEIKDVRN